MTEQRALRTEELHGARGCAGQFLDAPGEGDEARGEYRTGELGNVRRDFSNRSLEVRLDRFSLAFDELREARERLELGLLAFGQVRPDAFPAVDRHAIPSPVHRYEIDVRPRIDDGGQLREMESVPLTQPLQEDVLFVLQFVERADGLPKMIFGADRPSHPTFREFHHRGVEKVPSVAELLRLQERRALGGPVSAGSLETGLGHEHLLGDRHEFPFFVEDLPVLHADQAVGQPVGLFREEPLVDDLAVIQQEGSEPRRDEEHAAGRTGMARKSYPPTASSFAVSSSWTAVTRGSSGVVTASRSPAR